MFIAYKKSDKTLIARRETEWQCRMTAKGMDLGAYNTWITTITTKDDDGRNVVTYPSEDFTIVECTDENLSERINQLSDYININRNVGESRVYNIKWSDSKDTFVMTTDMDGKSVKIVESEEKDKDGKVTKTNYKMSHFSGDDSAKDARLLADKWTAVRRDRDNRLAETDFFALSDQTCSGNMQIYRQKLRDVPKDNSDPDNISWPTKP